MTRFQCFVFIRQDLEKAAAQSQIAVSLSASLSLLPSAIAAVVIANAYDSETSAYGQSEYTIDLQLFCLVGGYTQIGWACLAFLVQCLFTCYSDGGTTFAFIVSQKGAGGSVS